MDIASLIGTLMGLAMVLFGIIQSAGVSAIWNTYMDFPSAIITIGGSIAGVLACNSMADFINGFKSAGNAFKLHKNDPSEIIGNIINLSNIARKEGLLALEEAANDIDDDFLKKGVMLVVDGTDPELVRGILETDLGCIEDRHKKVIGFWEKWGELAPAWGMIGTLIGLINMLKDLQDASSIGPNMAVALITTLYGSLVSNWICNPIASKMSDNNAREIIMKEVTVEGLLSIQAGENPRVIEEKLKSFLSPQAREAYNAQDEAGGEE